jgi:hypothetical protein
MQRLIKRKSKIQSVSLQQRTNVFVGRAFRYLRNVVVFMAFFIITASAIQSATDRGVPYTIASIGPKYEYFATHKDEYNTLFLGSSLLYRHLSPKVFDATMEKQGFASYSFNFGAGGMRLFETRFLLRELMELQPKNLKWVFIETNLEGLEVESENIRKRRVIYYHDFPSLWTGINYILATNRKPIEKLQLLYQYIVPTFYHTVNLGVFSDQVFWEERLNWDLTTQLGQNHDGFIALDAETDRSFIRRRRNFLKRNENNPASNYLRRIVRTETIIKKLEAKRDRAKPLTAQKTALLKEMVSLVRAQGAEPVFIVPPALYKPEELRIQEQLVQAEQKEIIPALMDFRDPDKYPELYDIDSRFDGRYMNQEGARRFSQIVAREFGQMLSNSPT